MTDALTLISYDVNKGNTTREAKEKCQAILNCSRGGGSSCGVESAVEEAGW